MKMNLYDLLINHPGRRFTFQYTIYQIIASTPPSKGGETFTFISCNKTTRLLASRDRKLVNSGLLNYIVLINKELKTNENQFN